MSEAPLPRVSGKRVIDALLDAVRLVVAHLAFHTAAKRFQPDPGQAPVFPVTDADGPGTLLSVQAGTEAVNDQQPLGDSGVDERDIQQPDHLLGHPDCTGVPCDVALELSGFETEHVQAARNAIMSMIAKRRRNADIAEVAGTIARRNIHAAAKGDGEMGEIAAHAGTFFLRLEGRSGRIGMFIPELNVAMNEIADFLNARPTQRRPAEHLSGEVRQAVGITVTAAQQEHEGFLRQRLHQRLVAIALQFVGPSSWPAWQARAIRPVHPEAQPLRLLLYGRLEALSDLE